MNLAEFRAFIAVVDHGGIRPAARSMNVTPGVLSRALTRLEESLGAELLHRPAGVPATLTDHGAALLVELRPALDHLDRGILMARHHSTGVGTVLGVPPLPPVPELHRLLAATRGVSAESGLRLRRISWRDCFVGASLRSGRVDAVVSLLPGANAGLREIAVEPLRRVAVLAASHRLARQPRVSNKDLDGERAVVAAALSTASARVWALDPQADGKPRRYTRRPKTVSTMLSAIARGDGFTTMPAMTPLMWHRSDLVWPTIDAPPAWLGFTCGALTPPAVLETLEGLEAVHG